MIIKYFLNLNKFNFYFFFDKKIFYNNFKNYNIIVNPRLNVYNIFLSVHSYKFKYCWITNFSYFIRYFEVKNIFNFNINSKILLNDKIDAIINIVNVKKKTTMLKKSEDYEYVILNKFDSRKNDFLFKLENSFNFDLNNYEDAHFYKSLQPKWLDTTGDHFNFKNFDFKRKPILIFKRNRVLFRKILKVKHKRQYSFNRYIKNFIKSDQRSFIINLDYNIVIILIKSHFFFNKKDCIWFIENGFVSLNGSVITNHKKTLNALDVLNIHSGKSFFHYYNFFFNKGINNSYKYNLKIWKINKIRSNIVEKEKKEVEKYSNWIYNYMYFSDDIPNHLEVDFISMNVIILNISLNYSTLDYYNSKFLNIYLSRLYNWKFII